MRFLREALESVLRQTLDDFELLVVDDGSTDDTPEVLASVRDGRLRVLRQEHEGLVAALNRGADEARAPYLARMDADDVSLPQRLERQTALLAADESVGIVGCGVETIDEAGRMTSSWLLPSDDRTLRRRLLLRNPFTHGSVVVRRDAFDRAGAYRDDYGANEDYDLWRRIAREWRLAAASEVLYRYREHGFAVTKIDARSRIDARERLRDELWRETALVRGTGIERDPVEARALVREAIRRRRYGMAVRSLPGALRPATSA